MVKLSINIIYFENQHLHVDSQHVNVKNQHLSQTSTYENVDYQHIMLILTCIFPLNMDMLICNINMLIYNMYVKYQHINVINQQIRNPHLLSFMN